MSTQGQRALRLGCIMADMERCVNMLMQYRDSHREASASKLEEKARQLSQGCFASVLEALIEEQRQGAEESPHCKRGRLMVHKGDQVRYQETCVGRITWRRGYYCCPVCRRGCYPLHEALEIGSGQFSNAVQAGVSWAAAKEPFEPAAQTFTYLTRIRIAGREVGRVSEGRGAVLEAHQALEREKLLRGEGTTASQPRDKPGVWAVALEAARARFEDSWHDVHAGTVPWAHPKVGEDEMCGAKAGEQSYAVQVRHLQKAGEKLYAEAVKRGVDPGQDMVVRLADGAVGKWSQFALHFPKRVEVLDWWHAVDHL